MEAIRSSISLCRGWGFVLLEGRIMAQNRWMLFVVVVLSFLLCSCGNVYYTVRLKKTGDDAYRGKAVEGAVIGTKEAESATIYPIVLERMK